MKIIHQQATVIAEAVYGIQLLIKKGIITREELKEIRETLVHADSILSSGSGVQPESTGSDVDSGGSEEPGVSGVQSDRGDSDGGAVEKPGSLRPETISSVIEQSDPDSFTGEGADK